MLKTVLTHNDVDSTDKI